MDASFGSSTGRRPVDLALSFSLAAALAATVLFVHLPDFFRTIVSDNEGLYAVVAREVAQGHLPYITAWEAKPPLFFALLALAMHATGVSLVTLHVASLVAGFVTAYGVYRIGLAFGEDGERIGVFAALLTVALSASNKGTSAEAEVFVNAFVCTAFAIAVPSLVTRSLSPRNAFLAALFAGCAIGIKLTAVPAALVASAFAMIATPMSLQSTLAVCAGLLAPIVACILPYAAIGRIDAFVDANVGMVLRRGLGPVAHPQLYEVMRWESEAFFPVWALAPLALVRRWRGPERILGFMLLAWTCAAAVSLVAVREFFGYHFIMLVPPACLLGAWGFFRIRHSQHALRIALVIAALTLAGHGIGRYMTLAQPDPEAQTATILHQRIVAHPGTLYVAQGDAALYILSGEPIPTRFPYPQHLYAADMQRAANVDGIREVKRILASRPRYVVLRPDRGNAKIAALKAVQSILDRSYALAAASGEYRIYERDRP